MQGHCSLETFIGRAEDDNSLYAGLAPAIFDQHFAVDKDATQKLGGGGYCTSFQRLFAALSVGWSSSHGRFRAVLCVDPTLQVEMPTAFRDARVVTGNSAWNETIVDSLREVFRIREDPLLADLNICIMSSNTASLAEEDGLLGGLVECAGALPADREDYCNGVLSIMRQTPSKPSGSNAAAGASASATTAAAAPAASSSFSSSSFASAGAGGGGGGGALTARLIHMCANPSLRHGLLNVLVICMMLHGVDARAAPFAAAVGRAVESFVAGLSSSDFRRLSDPRNRAVVLAALLAKYDALTARAVLALLCFAGGELARSVALVKEQLAAQVPGGGSAAVDAYLMSAGAWVRGDAGALRPQKRMLVHDVYKGKAFKGEDLCDLLQRHQGGKSKVLPGTTATALLYRSAKHVLAGRGGRLTSATVGRLTSATVIRGICTDAGFSSDQVKGILDFMSLAHFVGSAIANKIADMWARHEDPDVIAAALKQLSEPARKRNSAGGELQRQHLHRLARAHQLLPPPPPRPPTQIRGATFPLHAAGHLFSFVLVLQARSEVSYSAALHERRRAHPRQARPGGALGLPSGAGPGRGCARPALRLVLPLWSCCGVCSSPLTCLSLLALPPFQHRRREPRELGRAAARAHQARPRGLRDGRPRAQARVLPARLRQRQGRLRDARRQRELPDADLRPLPRREVGGQEAQGQADARPLPGLHLETARLDGRRALLRRADQCGPRGQLRVRGHGPRQREGGVGVGRGVEPSRQ